MKIHSAQETAPSHPHRPALRHVRFGLERLPQLLAAALVVAMTLAPSLSGMAYADSPNFRDDVLPLLRTHCLSCHNPDEKESDLDLSTLEAIQAGSSGGTVVRAGSPDSSSLYRAVMHADDVAAMPPNQPRLSETELMTLREWIGGGLRADRGSKGQLRKVAFDVGAGGMGKPDEPAFPKGPFARQTIEPGKRTGVMAMASHPWSRLVAVSGERQVLLFGTPPKRGADGDAVSIDSTDPMTFLGCLDFPEGEVLDLRFSTNGELLLVAGGVGARSGRVALFDVNSGRRVATLGEEYDSILSADISADHRFVAIGTTSKLVKIHSAADGKLLHRIKKHTDWVTVVRFSPDGQRLASADRNGGIHVWESETGGIVFTLDEHRVAVNALDWRRDGRLLGSGGEDGKLVLWDMGDGWATRAIDAHKEKSQTRYSRRTGVLDLAFHHDGRLVTSGRDRRVKYWGTDGKPLGSFGPIESLPLQVETLRDEGQVIVGGFSGELGIWSLEDGQRSADFFPIPNADQQKR